MNPRWTKEEIEYLEENYSSTSFEEMSRVLNREIPAIQTKACKLKITKNAEWTDEEIEYLKNNIYFPRVIEEKVSLSVPGDFELPQNYSVQLMDGDSFA